MAARRPSCLMVAVETDSQDRLVRLLRLLQPAPRDWVTRMQHTISDMLVRDRDLPLESALMDGGLRKLTRALKRDPAFRRAFDADPIAAAEDAGWPELARALEGEMRALIALAERVAADDAFRAELERKPLTTLEAAGIPSDAAEELLRALSAPDDVFTLLPEVVAHGHEQEPIGTRLLILLLGATEVRETLRKLSSRA